MLYVYKKIQEQVIGFHDLPRVRGKALNIMPLQENEMMLYFATSMVTRINNSQIRTFSAFLDKPGDITFVILKPEAGNSSYSVAEYETFTSSSSGPITFDISQSPVVSYTMYQICKHIFLKDRNTRRSYLCSLL